MKLRPAERKKRWQAARQAVADEWFQGDASKADDVLDALPFSSIPDWTDVDAVCRAVQSPAPESPDDDRWTRENIVDFATWYQEERDHDRPASQIRAEVEAAIGGNNSGVSRA